VSIYFCYFSNKFLVIFLVPFQLIESSLIVALKKKALYITSISTSCLKLVLFLILVPFWGIWGIVAAILIAEVLRSLLALYFFLKI